MSHKYIYNIDFSDKTANIAQEKIAEVARHLYEKSPEGIEKAFEIHFALGIEGGEVIYPDGEFPELEEKFDGCVDYSQPPLDTKDEEILPEECQFKFVQYEDRLECWLNDDLRTTIDTPF